MKKGKWKWLAGTLMGAALIIGATGCEFMPQTTEKTDFWSMDTVYAKAQELGYTGTLEEFMATIQGANGKDGTNGLRFENLYSKRELDANFL